MAELIYQKEMVDSSRLRQIASRDVCTRIIKRLVLEGKIVRQHDTKHHNAIYFNAEHGKIVRDAFEAEAQLRLTSLAPAAAEPETPEPLEPAVASEPEEGAKPKGSEEPAPKLPKEEPKSLKQLATAPGPEKRTPAKKVVEPTESAKQEKKGIALSKSVWLYVGAGALLLLGFGWWRAHRGVSLIVRDHFDTAHPAAPPTTEPLQPRQTTDKEQLARWDRIFGGL